MNNYNAAVFYRFPAFYFLGHTLQICEQSNPRISSEGYFPVGRSLVPLLYQSRSQWERDGTLKWGNCRKFNKDIYKVGSGIKGDQQGYGIALLGWKELRSLVLSRSERLPEPGEGAVVVGRGHRRGYVALGRRMFYCQSSAQKDKSWKGEAAGLSGLDSRGKPASHPCVCLGTENLGDSHQHITLEILKLCVDQ